MAACGGGQILVDKLEEFREGELVSLFVHPFRPDVASVAERIQEIFRGNAEARPLRLPGEPLVRGWETQDISLI